MKSNVIFFLLGFSLFVIMSFQDSTSVKQNQVVDFRDARVKMNSGMALFIQCEPINKYKYLGSFKVSVAWTGQTPEMIGIATKKVKSQFPEANGIIFTSDDQGTFDAVLFE